MKNIDKLYYFKCNPDKSPAVKWQNSSNLIEIGFKDLLDPDFNYKYENVGLIIPEGFSVIDFDTPKDKNGDYVINPEDYKKKVFSSLEPYIRKNNIIMKTDKGLHLWIKNNLAQSTMLVNELGFTFDIRAAKKGYVIIKRKNKKRKIIGNGFISLWRNSFFPYAKWSEIGDKARTLFKNVLRGHNLKGERNNLLFSVYKIFLIRDLKITSAYKLNETIYNFNDFWKLGLSKTEVTTIARITEKEKKKEFRENYYSKDNKIEESLQNQIFICKWDKIEGRPLPIVSKKGKVELYFLGAIKSYMEQFKDSFITLNDIFYIINEVGEWISDDDKIMNHFSDWLISELKKYNYSDYKYCGFEMSSIVSLMDNIRIRAVSKEENWQKAYLFKDKKVLVNDCEIEKFDKKKHQVLAYVDREIIPEKEINMKYVKQVCKFIQQLVKEKESFFILINHMRYVLMPHKRAKKMLLLTGKTNSGKSTLCVFMSHLLGFKKVTTTFLSSLFMNQFGIADIINSLLFYDDDIEGYFEKAKTGLFKNVISNETLRAEKKYQQSRNKVSVGKLWALTNGTINIPNTEGVDNRIDIITFNKLSEKKIKFNVLDQFSEQHYLHFLAWLIYNKDLPASKISNNLLNAGKWEFLAINNTPFNYFMELIRERNFAIHSTLYKEYSIWCEDNGIKRPVSNGTYQIQLKRWKEEYWNPYKKYLKKQIK